MAYSDIANQYFPMVVAADGDASRTQAKRNWSLAGAAVGIAGGLAPIINRTPIDNRGGPLSASVFGALVNAGLFYWFSNRPGTFLGGRYWNFAFASGTASSLVGIAGAFLRPLRSRRDIRPGSQSQPQHAGYAPSPRPNPYAQ